MEQVYRILLLTNRDSDNTGDQIMEICDLALIDVAMENLGISKDGYEVSSRATSTFMKEFFQSGDEKFLKRSRRKLKETDLVIYGGSPVFNHTFQDFSEWTCRFLEICQEENVPVVMSAIGIEYYDEKDPKCQRIRSALNLPVVRQVTTRDDIASLKRMKQREDLIIGRVADPAVFAKEVFEGFLSPCDRIWDEKELRGSKGKRIGIFVLRGEGFRDHGFAMGINEAAAFWRDLYYILGDRGYDVELLTNGHYGDEAFLDRMVREYGIPMRYAKFNINEPENVIEYLSRYDGVVSARLHPNILSYSLGIPSTGIGWNMKVEGFYDAAGYGGRVVDVGQMTAAGVADRIEEAMAAGVETDVAYRMSVYETLYRGMGRALLGEASDDAVFSYDEVCRRLPRFAGTDENERYLKLRRKLRRIYGTYNKYQDVIDKMEKIPFLKKIYKRHKK